MKALGDEFHFVGMLWFWEEDRKTALVCPGKKPSEAMQKYLLDLFFRYQRENQFPLSVAEQEAV
jgi:hypothetical protein